MSTWLLILGCLFCGRSRHRQIEFLGSFLGQFLVGVGLLFHQRPNVWLLLSDRQIPELGGVLQILADHLHREVDYLFDWCSSAS
jgi:hypothetical protein